MGFIDRIGSFLPKGKIANKANYNTGNWQNIKTINNNLAHDAFKNTNQVQRQNSSNPITIDRMALLYPAIFINRYINKETIENALNKNPEIKKILDEYNLPNEFEIENANSIIMSHLIPTARTAQKIYKLLGHTEQENDYIYLTQAGLLHDIGKVFIPSAILNKKGKLTPKEREIVELHNKLSYEILKTTDLNPKVAQLAYEHHDYEKNLKRTQENQCLTISDVYCALREKRPYKKPISEMCAKAILYDMGTKGKFDTRYINYLSA